MNTSNTLSSQHASHSFVVRGALTMLKIIGRVFTAQPRIAHDLSSSLCPLL